MTFASPSEAFGNQIALSGINFYRQYLSPLKGFNCAAGALGCRTCSTMAKRLFKRYPFNKAFGLQLQQFKRCKESADLVAIIQNAKPNVAEMVATLDLSKPHHQAMALLIQSLMAAGRSMGAGGAASGGCPCSKLPLLGNVCDQLPCNSSRCNPISSSDSGKGKSGGLMDLFNPF